MLQKQMLLSNSKDQPTTAKHIYLSVFRDMLLIGTAIATLVALWGVRTAILVLNDKIDSSVDKLDLAEFVSCITKICGSLEQKEI